MGGLGAMIVPDSGNSYTHLHCLVAVKRRSFDDHGLRS